MRIIQGDLLSNKEGIIVHGCNCRGVMGAGFAAQLRRVHPGAYSAYKRHEARLGLELGDVAFAWNPCWRRDLAAKEVDRLLNETGIEESIPQKLIVANALTQRDYGRQKGVCYVDYEAVQRAFARIREVALATGMVVRFPMIGAGLAGGDWAVLREMIAQGLGEVFERSELWVLEGASGV